MDDREKFKKHLEENLKTKNPRLELSDVNIFDADIDINSFCEKFNHIKEVSMLQNSSDISFIRVFPQINELHLLDNNIKDVSTLTNLKKLEILDLGMNAISDISPIKNLKNLKKLSLGLNDISNINDLSELNELTVLYLSDNSISDIYPLV